MRLTIQSAAVDFHRQWRQLRESAAERRPIRVALAASFTVEPLVPYFGCFLAQRGFAPQFVLAPYGQIYQSLLDSGSAVRAGRPDVTLVLARVEDLCARQLGQLASLEPDCIETARAEARGELARLSEALLDFEKAVPSALLVGTLPPPWSTPLGLLDASHPASLHHLVHELNLDLWRTAQRARRLRLVDMGSVLSHLGMERVWDHRMAYLAGCPLSAAALRLVGERLSRAVAPLFLPSAKVVVVDLDNTLWGGIAGEDGLHGIAVGDSGIGAAFADFQDALLALRAQGVLLAIASKNNAADAFEMIDHHPGMRLRREHFAAHRIDWHPKSESLRELARELSLGLDSFVFVDDSPTECEEVRRLLPEVTVVELPQDPACYVEVLRSTPALDRMLLTTEDRMRARSYEGERARAAAFASTDTSDPDALRAHLRSLELKVAVRRLRSTDVARAAQLTQKTNQFNLTTIRRTEAEVELMRCDSDWALYGVEVVDRFGDYGQAGLVFAKRTAADSWYLDTVLLSCRVLGRGVESTLMWLVIVDLTSRGAKRLTASFVPTAKNAPAADFLPRHGFCSDGSGQCVREPLPGEPFDVDYVAAHFDGEES